MKTWTNITDKTLRNRLGYQTVNQIKDNLINILEARPWRPTGDTGTWMVYKDANTYTVKAGYYLVGDTVYQLVADLDWTWSASGQNRGMDDGGAGNAASTFYYLYGIVYSAAFGVVASATAPTARFDTNLSGSSYDTNVYLGAVYNDASQNLLSVGQLGNLFSVNTLTEVGSTTSTSYTAKTLLCPMSANITRSMLRIYSSTNGANGEGLYSVDGTTGTVSTGLMYMSSATARSQVVMFDSTIPTARTGWIKTTDANCTAYLYQYGWFDKFLG